MGKTVRETATQRLRRLKKEKQKRQLKKQEESSTDRVSRLAKKRHETAELWLTELSSSRIARLVKKRDAEKERRLHEMPTARDARRAKERHAIDKRRRNRSPSHRNIRKANQRAINMSVEAFDRNVSVYADCFCEVCYKRCYPNQASTCWFGDRSPDYLPIELSNKKSLLLCHRCKTHLTSKKTMHPPKAYWNNLDPGEIPPEIAVLTQVEIRLLARIISFVKIIKYDGVFGQYGFKGQAVLFGQDIFEVTDKLPTMLPRSPDSTGLVIVTESLENLDITREFTISVVNLSNAIEWLKANNQLYHDVQNVSSSVQLNIADLIRVQPPSEPLPSRIKISQFSTIIRAGWNQGNAMFGVNAGKQCCAMAIGAIIHSIILPPSQWDSNIINGILIESDGLYETVLLMSNPVMIPPSGFLLVNQFDVICHDITMFDASFSFHYDQDPAIFGSLDDQKNPPGGIGVRLSDGLKTLFNFHPAGVLIANMKSFAVIKSNGLFYFVDSHSCGPKGAPAINGRACVIECSTFDELIRICKRATGSKNVEYTLDYIDVIAKNDNVDTNMELELDQNGQISSVGSVHEPSPLFVVDSIAVETSVMAPIDLRGPQDNLAFAGIPSDGEKCKLLQISRKTTNNIVNDRHELKAEEFAWYHLFPNGINGLKETRTVLISPLDYFQSRIMSKDTRFQRTDYLFYALSMYEFHRITTNINVCGKKIQHDNEMVEDVHLYVKNLRGSMAYWNSAMSELIAQIRCLGPPHYFITFSCNDLHWEDMIRAMLIAHGEADKDPKTVGTYEAQKLVEKYPVVVSRHFMIRVNAMMTLLKSDDTILGGKLVDHWWRIEFQNRGSPHLHMLVWIEGTPNFDSSEGITRIDEVMTCELPDDPEMKVLVNGVQRHRHSQTCHKNGSIECRFNFPRISSEQTHIVANTSNEFMKNGGRMCILKRKPEENFINNYNVKLLKCWKGNMDIQPCGSNESIAMYIAKYCAKNEPTEMSSGLKEAIRKIRYEESNTSAKLFKICMKILHERQVSACECVYRLCHLPLKQSSRRCVFINTRKPEQRYKVLRFVNEDAAGFCTNIIERYTKRPLDPHCTYQFEQMSLMEFAMLFEPHYSKVIEDEDGGDQDVYDVPVVHQNSRLLSLLDGSKMKIRSRPAVVRVPFFREADDPDNYYYSLLAQYLAFRDEAELLEGYDSPKNAFLKREAQLKASSEHLEIHRARDRQLDNAINQANAFILLADPVIDDDLNDHDQGNDNDVRPNEIDFQLSLAKMNVQQRDLFNFITQSIEKQFEKGYSERVKMFITGGAGTGKTFTLNLIKEQIRRCYGGEMDSVKIGALTGVAAKLISGRTLHSMFKLPVQRDGKLTRLPNLTGIYLKTLRYQWRNTQFLIIDEISMVPYEMLEHLNSRLQQLRDSTELFGGMNILLFGDLMQLPPVRGSSVFHQPKSSEPATHLWRTLSFCELTQNMRQRGDTTFINLLNDLRIGEIKAEHIAILIQKVDKNLSGNFAIGKAIRIDPTNAMVDEHNAQALRYHHKQGLKMVHLRAADRISDAIKDISNIEVEKLIPEDINKTGGLPKTLTLFVGAKVMLRYNVDTSKGLVNGAMGEVVDVIWPLFRREQMYPQDLPHVKVNFLDIGEHVIEPRTAEFPAKMSAGTAERRMLPLILCWAVTVHKMQGSTVDYAVINLGSKLFAKGQAYVALSRVRSLEGIRLEDLDSLKLQNKTYCNLPALAEMERLRKLPCYEFE